ncbi:hypothetical protein [Domibacillus indicus]|uniref:hypothetical protein n=1 Tax=Domibacillus indicus TaxID=1437523 RepID=UPI0006180D48|nr:hypothetical protein [Domibacillus indicus]
MTLNSSSFPHSSTAEEQALIDQFKGAIGHKIFILTPSYPFLFIGKIISLKENNVELFVETTHFAALEKRIWLIHIPHIEVFYIEFPGEPRIPELNDMV